MAECHWKTKGKWPTKPSAKQKYNINVSKLHLNIASVFGVCLGTVAAGHDPYDREGVDAVPVQWCDLLLHPLVLSFQPCALLLDRCLRCLNWYHYSAARGAS